MITEQEVVDLLKQGYDIHICDGAERTITIGSIFDKKNIAPETFDKLYADGKGILRWLGGVGTSRGIESRFSRRPGVSAGKERG